MKNLKLILFALITLFITACSQKTIELPLIHKIGYGPFLVGFNGGPSPYSDDDGPWKGTRLKVKGIPEDWENAKVGDLTINIRQKVYQNALTGNISKEFYKVVQDGWEWIPDTLKLSKIPIKTNVAFVYKEDTSGNISMIIDANNNLDFSDDKVFTPMYTRPGDDDAGIEENQIMITYEEYLNNEIIKVNAHVFIYYSKIRKVFMHNFPKYAVVKFKGEEFAICSKRFNTSYDDINIVMLTDSLKQGKKASRQEYITEYIDIEGERYRIKGVDIGKDVLVLEKIDTPKDQIYSTQVGFKSPLFKGKDLVTKDSLVLEDFKGKYLYIDFWALWCGPCIAELPHLTELYGKIDKSQFEFLGIVSSSGNDEDAIKKMMDKHSVSWSHILSNKANNIEKLYGVNSWPTTLLLDKEGRIIAKDLRGKALEDKIKELTR